jgi:two-component system phosphate regulon sensor histidine kinase PhoR
VLDINSKLHSKLVSNFFSSIVYYKEFIFINLLIIFILVLFAGNYSFIPSLIIAIFIINVTLFYLLGKRREEELEKIKSIINDISLSKYNNEDEIQLGDKLISVQEAIRKMFRKEKSDIENMQRLQKVRSQFLANVSHELRTPIFAIQGYIETLLSGAINDKKVNRNFLEKANQNTISLSNLLNDLIDISMIESGEMRMSYRYFKINDLVNQVCQENKKLADDKSLIIQTIPAGDDLQVFGDRDKIRQVLINLVQNAIKYTEKGRIEIIVEEEDKLAKIIVKDTGIGIPENYLDRIFERFFRIDKARSRSIGGTGLGLAIVKHIVEAHHSTVKVKSRIGEGSEFSFHLKK